MDIKLFNEVSWGGNKLAPVVDWALREMNIGKTPAMMINGEIVLEGRIPSGPEVLYILKRSLEEKESQVKKE